MARNSLLTKKPRHKHALICDFNNICEMLNYITNNCIDVFV